MRTTLQRVIEITIVLIVLLVLIPESAGGAATYVRIQGNSMLPTFRAGDTVLLTRDDHYEKGEIIAYRSRQLGGAVVIHRIIEVTSDASYVTQGDNNDFIDDYQPSKADVLGKYVVHIPGAERVARFLRSPFGLAVVVFVIWLLLYWRPRRQALHRRHAMRGRAQ